MTSRPSDAPCSRLRIYANNVVPSRYYTEAKKDFYDRHRFGGYLVGTFLALPFLIGVIGVTYHLTGHVTSQREQGLLQLVDAMMPNVRKWECLVARITSTHLAFDIM